MPEPSLDLIRRLLESILESQLRTEAKLDRFLAALSDMKVRPPDVPPLA